MKKCIFYCDIEGTYITSLNKKNPALRKQELQKFANALDFLCEQNDDNEMFFGFISSNKIHDVLNYIKEFLPYIEKSKYIKLGTSFSEEHKIIGQNLENIQHHHSPGKPFQIVKNIDHITSDELYKIHADINRVYYADDCLFQHTMVMGLLPIQRDDIDLVDFIPGTPISKNNVFGVVEKGIQGVIGSMMLYLKSINKKTFSNNANDNPTNAVEQNNDKEM